MGGKPAVTQLKWAAGASQASLKLVLYKKVIH